MPDRIPARRLGQVVASQKTYLRESLHVLAHRSKVRNVPSGIWDLSRTTFSSGLGIVVRNSAGSLETEPIATPQSPP